jgi:hypothetical protein
MDARRAASRADANRRFEAGSGPPPFAAEEIAFDSFAN